MIRLDEDTQDLHHREIQAWQNWGKNEENGINVSEVNQITSLSIIPKNIKVIKR